MKLNETYRECFVDKLETLTSDMETLENVITNNTNSGMHDYYHASRFLIELQLKAIRQGLIDNDIDY